ncbi:MAG: SpoIID/LytB domain-containing protein [Anaerolineae bacterium]
MSKTTLHCQRIPGWAPAALAAMGAGWVKLVNPPAGADPFPALRKDVRIWTDDWDRACIARGAAGADEYMARMLTLWAPFRGWAGVAFELPNEPECNSNEGLAALNAFTRRCCEIGDRERLRLVILNLPEGNPGDNGTGDVAVTRWKVQQLAGGVGAAVAGGHLVGLHGYWRPGVEGPTGRYHALRCVDMVTWWAAAGVDVGRLRLALTEWGVDGGIAGMPAVHGWRDLMTQAEYVAQCVEGERALRGLPWLEFAALFTAGPEAPWWTYEQDEGTVGLIAEGVRGLPEVDVVDPVDTVRVWRRATGAVEVMELEQYLRGVVPAEMPASWPAPALAAQAVAARTYTLAAIASPRHSARGADLCDSTCCQVWRAGTYEASDAAVRETVGEVWPVGDGSYVAWCGREDCPACEGRPGTNGNHFPTRLCQNGARMLAERGWTYQEILAHYYGGSASDGGEEGTVGQKYPEIRAWTWDGKPTTVEALQAVYGFEIKRATVAADYEVFRLTAVREKAGDVAIIVRVLNADGSRRAGQAVAGHFPDERQQNPSPFGHDWYRNYVVGYTNAEGEVTAQVMSGGSVIRGADGGPHAAWPLSQSVPADCLDRIGWDGATDHRHVDGEWTLVVQEATVETPSTPETPATETPEPDAAAIGDLRWQAEEAVRGIEAAQAALAQARERLLREVIAPAYALEGVGRSS